MKRFCRVMAASLIIAMSLSTAACSKSGDTATESAKTTTTEKTADATENPTEVVAETPTEAASVIDTTRNLDGYEYTIACFYGANVWNPEPGSSEMADLMLERYAEIEEQNNATITMLSLNPDEFNDQVNTAAAAGTKFADQLHMNIGTYYTLMRAGYLAPMNDLKDIDITAPKWNQDYYSFTTNVDDGKLYGLDFLSWPDRKLYPDQCLFFNKTLIAELGLPDPYELYDKGEWTWDTFRQILKDATRDTNGDGETDVYGMTLVGNLLEFSALYSNGAHTYDVVDGKYKYALANDAAYKALDFAATIRNTDKTFLSFPEGTHWGAPLDAFKGHQTVFFMRDVIYFQDVKDNDHQFGMVAFPKGPDIKADAYPAAAWNNDDQVQGIFKIGNDVDKAAYIFNRITEPVGDYAVDSWKEYALRNHFMKDQKAFDIYQQMCKNAFPDGGGSVYASGTMDKIGQALIDAGQQIKTPVESLTAIQEELQTYLDETYNNK